MLLLQGRSEFLEKYEHVAAALVDRGFEVRAFDWRGQGGSTRPLADPEKGHVARFEDYLGDLCAWRAALPAPPGPEILLAHSMGGHLALRHLLTPGPLGGDAAAAVLVAPMFDIRLPRGTRRATRRLIRLLSVAGHGHRYAPGQGRWRPLPFAGNPLTRDRARFEATQRLLLERPDLRLGGPTVGWLEAAFRSIAGLTRHPGLPRCDVPTLIVSGGADTVVCNRSHRRLAARMPTARRLLLPGGRHEVLEEVAATRQAFWQAFDQHVGV